MGKALLFEDLPKRPNLKRMHVHDAGGDFCVNFVCGHCGYDDGWTEMETVTKAKRGKPCPKCNPSSKDSPS